MNMLKKLFETKDGKIVIAQRPNTSIIIWLVAKPLSLIFADTLPGLIFDGIAFGALFYWALLEVFQGVNLFRKILGVIVILILLVPLVFSILGN